MHAVARDLDVRLASRFVSMYVNERTLDYGADAAPAIRKLLDLGHERGIIPIARRLTSSMRLPQCLRAFV